MSKYPDELVERAFAVIRVAATLPKFPHDADARHVAQEAAAIVAELPQPVDQDLVEAREIACKIDEATWGVAGSLWRQSCRKGFHDNGDNVQQALIGVKHMRALASEGR